MKLARKSYPSFTKTVVENFSVDTTKAFADVVKEEAKVICSDKTNSVLKSDNVTDFSWDQVWSELLVYMPRLATFLKELLPNSSSGNRRVICMIMSMILKVRYPKMCLVQKVISMYLFGNSVHKKVFCLFMLKTSPSLWLTRRFTTAFNH